MPKTKTNTNIKDLKKTIIDKETAVETNAPDKSEQAKKAEILFDCAAPQKVYLTFNHKGRLVEVCHVLNFPSDERIIQFYKEAKVIQKTSATGIETESEVSNAAVKLWDELAVSRSGYADSNRADWKEKTSSLHKESAITGLLSAAGSFPKILDAEFLGVDDDEQITIQIKSLFDGGWLFPEIIFNQPNAEQMRRYKKIRNVNFRNDGETLVETQSINLPDRAALFGELVFESVGYRAGVPIHHQAEAINTLFENQIEVIAKN